MYVCAYVHFQEIVMMSGDKLHFGSSSSVAVHADEVRQTQTYMVCE